MQRRPAALSLFGILVTAGCGDEIEPPFLNYQDCIKKTTDKYEKRGTPSIKARLDAREHCRGLYR